MMRKIIRVNTLVRHLNGYTKLNAEFRTNGATTTVHCIDTGETVRATTDQELDNLIIKLCSIIKKN